MFLWNLSDVIARGKFEYTLFEKKMVIFALIEAAILLAVLAYIIPEQGQTIAFAVMAGLSGVYATIRATALYYYYKK